MQWLWFISYCNCSKKKSSFHHGDFYFRYKHFSHILYLDFHFLNLMSALLERQIEVQLKGNAEWAEDSKRTFLSFSWFCVQWWRFPFRVWTKAVHHRKGAPGTDYLSSPTMEQNLLWHILGHSGGLKNPMLTYLQLSCIRSKEIKSKCETEP